MKLATYISDLLYRYECVIIPNFGGFVTNEISAKVNAFTHTFNAPSKQLTFNSHLQNNDGLLANYIANVANVSYSNAVEIINAEVKNWKLQLKNEEIELNQCAYVGGSKNCEKYFISILTKDDTKIDINSSNLLAKEISKSTVPFKVNCRLLPLISALFSGDVTSIFNLLLCPCADFTTSASSLYI